jgi:uncharacterized membrane protein
VGLISNEPVTADPATSARGTRSTPLAVAVATVFGALYATLSVARYDRLDVRSWDLAIFAQAARSYAERGYPVVDIKGPGFNLLGDHFSPVVALFGPLWALAPSPVTLLVAQAVLLAVSVGVVLVAAVRHLGTAGGTAVGVAYGLSFGLAEAADFDVHEVAFAVPLLALAGSAYVRRDWRGVCLWALPLLLVKEDQGLTVAAIGVVLLLSGARRWGLGLLLVGAAATAVVLLLVIPAFNPDGGYDYWDRLASGGDGRGLGQVMLALPREAVLPPVKVETLLVTFGITGFLALRSPWVLVALPTLGWRFLSGEPYYWGTEWHYSLTLMPIVFLALVDGVVRSRETAPTWLARYARYVPSIAVAVALALSLQSPLRDLTRSSTYADNSREQSASRVLSAIPDGDTVAVDITLMAPLVTDHTVYFIGTNVGPAAVVPEWVVVGADSGWQPGELADWAGQQWPGSAWRDVGGLGPDYLLARRTQR